MAALFFCVLFSPRFSCVRARVHIRTHTNEISVYYYYYIYIRNKEQRKEDKKQGRKETSKQERQKENKAKREYNNTESKKREWKTQGKRKKKERNEKRRVKGINIKARPRRVQNVERVFLAAKPTNTKRYATQIEMRRRRALPPRWQTHSHDDARPPIMHNQHTNQPTRRKTTIHVLNVRFVFVFFARLAIYTHTHLFAHECHAVFSRFL